MLLFWHAEGYIPAMIKYEMPKKAKKRLPVLNADELQQLLKVCNVRDKAIFNQDILRSLWYRYSIL
jgi:hypothetical protein